MHARVVVGVGKGVLFREVSSVQRCPYREVPLYMCGSVFCVHKFIIYPLSWGKVLYLAH